MADINKPKSIVIYSFMSKRSFKYRIYPNQIQCKALDSVFLFCRNLYNCALEERISFYKKYKKSLSYNFQAGELKEIKQDFTHIKGKVYSQTLQEVLKQLDKAYSGFFRRLKSGGKSPGFPRFKAENRFNSICFPQADLKSGGIKLVKDKLEIFGIPDFVKIKLHRPFQGNIKQIRIIKKLDKWFIVLSCDNISDNILNKTGKTCGIDLGLHSFITLDDGTSFHHPKPWKTAKDKLAYLNRKLSEKQKGSNNRKRVKGELAKVYEKVSNIREDFQHKLSLHLVKKYDTIILEKLNIKEMLESKSFQVKNSNIVDAAWGNFVAKLTYKAESAGKKIIFVDPRNTSKMCSECGVIRKLELSDRKYNCQTCSLSIDRDQNAAINIKRLGINLAMGITPVSEAITFK